MAVSVHIASEKHFPERIELVRAYHQFEALNLSGNRGFEHFTWTLRGPIKQRKVCIAKPISSPGRNIF